MTTTPPATDPRLMSDDRLAECHADLQADWSLADPVFHHIDAQSDQIKALTADLDRMRQERTDAERVVMLIQRLLDCQSMEDSIVTIFQDEATKRYAVTGAFEGEHYDGDTLLASLEAAAAAKGVTNG